MIKDLKVKSKVLFVANIHKHIKAFHIPYINWLKSQGYEVHVAANDGVTRIDEADKQFDLPINRNPLSLDNIKAIKELGSIIEEEKYCLIHCHTAMGSVVARLAAKKYRKLGLKVLYTAHGFHFYKGSSVKYWLMYYPMEKYLSAFTDGIITINKEDFQLIRERKFKNKNSFLISGVGINAERFDKVNETISQIKSKNNYNDSDFLFLYVAEFIERKNHEFLVNCAVELKKEMSNFKILFAGRGRDLDKIKNLIVEKGVDDVIDVLGFRSDIGEIVKMINVGVSVSHQEGLPMNIAEELYMGKPVIATKIRGHVDLIDHEKSGFLFENGNQRSFIDYAKKLKENHLEYSQMSKSAKVKSQEFLLKNCLQEMKKIYNQFLDV
jgi:glycosyltransferase EpsD